MRPAVAVVAALVLHAALAVCAPAATPVASTNTAQIRLFCFSIRTEPGAASLFGLDYSLTFSSAGFSAPNHELYAVFEDDFTHATYLLLDGTDFPEPIEGELALLVPEDRDVNTNGVPDFYEVALAAEGVVGTGLWGSPAASGEVRATWNRAAGQRRGTAKFELTSDEFGDLPEFTHAFEIIEYGGSLHYTPGSDPVRGNASLKRVGMETATLVGPLIFNREPTNRLNQLILGDSVVTNEAGLDVPVSLGDIERDPGTSMDYFGVLALANGDPETPEMDYELFYLGIDDPNDSDKDGIPDLSDDVRLAPAPVLSLARAGDEYRLTIRAEPGFTYSLEQARILDPELWTVDRQITLTESNQIVTLPLPAAVTRFWRMRWP